MLGLITHQVEGWRRCVQGRILRSKQLAYALALPSDLKEKYFPRLAKVGEGDQVKFNTLVLDLNGTCTIEGKLVDGVIPLLAEFRKKNIRIVILTADVRGTAASVKGELEASGLTVELVSLEDYNPEGVSGTLLKKLSWMLDQPDADIAYIGNGAGDAFAAGVAAISLGVCQREGMAGNLAQCVDVIMLNILDALNFLMDEAKIKAMLNV